MRLSIRLKILQIAMLGGFCVLALGLFQTQVIRGPEFRKASEQNRMRLIRLEAPRGTIYDRNGTLLAANRPAYNVYMIPEDFDPVDLPELARLLGLSADEIRKRISAARTASFTPVLVKRDITKALAMQLEELRPRFGGLFIQVQGIRAYPEGEVASHIVGYIGKISRAEYDRSDRSVFHLNSWIGRSGIEKVYDEVLRGEDGGRRLEVNARGFPISLLGERKPKPGRDLKLSLDAKFSAELVPLLEGYKGTILVMDVVSGGLLAAVSRPAFDPNVFVSPGRSRERLEIIGSRELPLLHRGFNGLYPPGSIFKLVTAMAGLETGVITPHTTFHCPGYFRFNNKSRKFKCWFHEGHGRVDLYTAIERSCNVYFYNTGRLLGEKRIAEYARKLGFGKAPELEVPAAGGLVPDAKWKKKRYQEGWYAGETIMYAIGQGYLMVSPLQILRLVSAVATDGRIFEAKLIHEEVPNPKPKRIAGREETFRALRQGMLRAVSSDKGTGQLARVDFGKLGAKTGTAQAPPGAAHAWFGGFFPVKDPKIALIVFLERGESGGLYAAKIAKQVVEIWNQHYGTAFS